MNQLSFILFHTAAYEAIDQLTRRFWRTRRNETLFASSSVHILVKSAQSCVMEARQVRD